MTRINIQLPRKVLYIWPTHPKRTRKYHLQRVKRTCTRLNDESKSIVIKILCFYTKPLFMDLN